MAKLPRRLHPLYDMRHGASGYSYVLNRSGRLLRSLRTALATKPLNWAPPASTGFTIPEWQHLISAASPEERQVLIARMAANQIRVTA
jgi:hypothetical protein